MSEEKTLQATVTETGESTFAVAIDVSGHKLAGDEPEDSGGKNLGPAPYDFLLASLSECTAMTVRWYARQKGWPLEKVGVTVTHRKEKRPDQKFPVDVFSKKITLHAPGLDENQQAKLIEIAAKCPIQRTLEGQPEIQTIWA